MEIDKEIPPDPTRFRFILERYFLVRRSKPSFLQPVPAEQRSWSPGKLPVSRRPPVSHGNFLPEPPHPVDKVFDLNQGLRRVSY